MTEQKTTLPTNQSVYTNITSQRATNTSQSGNNNSFRVGWPRVRKNDNTIPRRSRQNWSEFEVGLSIHYICCFFLFLPRRLRFIPAFVFLAFCPSLHPLATSYKTADRTSWKFYICGHGSTDWILTLDQETGIFEGRFNIARQGAFFHSFTVHISAKNWSDLDGNFYHERIFGEGSRH